MGGRDPRIKLGALELEVFRYFLSFFFSSPHLFFFFFDDEKKSNGYGAQSQFNGKRYV